MLAVTPFALLIFVAVVLLLVSAVFEMIIQKALFLDEQKSTESEKKRESKDQHGSPEIRKERERLRQDQANSSAVPLSADDATILFEDQDGLMGIYYFPPEQTIPVVCAKLRPGKEAKDLVKDLKQYGVLVVQNEAVFRNAKTRGIGESLDSSVFQEFARALTGAYRR